MASGLQGKGTFSMAVMGTSSLRAVSKQQVSVFSASPLAELEDKIRRHTQQIHARSFLGTNPMQDIKTANQDLETVSICGLFGDVSLMEGNPLYHCRADIL